MRFLKFDAEKCTLCRECLNKCPFGALSMEASGIEVGETCKMCGVCVKNCKAGAIRFEQKAGSADKSLWRDILIYGEQENGKVHPVVYELIGEAKKLAAKVNYQVKVVLIGKPGTKENADGLLSYGVDVAYVYEHEGFDGFKADCYADAMADCIAAIHPSVVLIGATRPDVPLRRGFRHVFIQGLLRTVPAWISGIIQIWFRCARHLAETSWHRF